MRLVEFFGKRTDVLLVFVFGSAASGKETEESDIDIGILFSVQSDFYMITDLKNALNSVFKKEIDIADLNLASPILKMQVLKNGAPVFVKDKKYYNQFYVDTLNQYDDLKQTRKGCEANILHGRIYA